MDTKRDSKDKIKQAVKKRYAKAITKAGASCCGKGAVESLPAEKVLCMAGYQLEELNSIPPEARGNSMGCGNPLAFAEVLPGQTVLDLGSGAGLDCFIAAEKVGSQGKVYGLDMTPEMISQAKKNAQEGGFTNVEFLLGEVENIPLPEASVDWVISNCVLNLSPDKPKAFSEIARVLRPGGRISISDIVVQDIPAQLRQNLDAWSACVGGAISEEEYVKGLESAGLKKVKVASRHVYSPEEMEAILGEEIKQYGLSAKIASAGGCCGGPSMDKLAGKIASVRFEGVKK
jgi:ubiquinone/menaquinone biosynthesis C-methylase UbiE